MAGSETTDPALSPLPDLLAELLACLPYPLDRDQLDTLAKYTSLFRQWNERFRFSKFSSPEGIITELLLPSLGLAILLPQEGMLLDLGSGPGIPGVPIQILRPALKVTCLESSDSCVEFLRACASTLPLPDLDILPARAESLAHDPLHRGAFDGVVARAFAPLAMVVEIASAFVRPGGFITIQCSTRTSSAIAEHDALMAPLGCRFDRIGTVSLSPPAGIDIPYARFHQISPPDPACPRSWKAMKTRPLWRSRP